MGYSLAFSDVSGGLFLLYTTGVCVAAIMAYRCVITPMQRGVQGACWGMRVVFAGLLTRDTSMDAASMSNGRPL